MTGFDFFWHRLHKHKFEGVALSLNEEFNYGFGYPQSDTCEQCDLLKVAIDSAQTNDERDKLQMKLATHQEKAAQGYQPLRLDSEKSKGDADSLVLTFDLQQNLPVPTLTHGAMFYMRQLWVYNCIHDCSGSGSAVMCVWNGVLLEGGQMKSFHACWSILHGNGHKLGNLPAIRTVVLVRTKTHR